VPRRLLHPRRKTIGIWVPDNVICRALLAELDQPILSTTLLLPPDDGPLTDPYEMRERLDREVALVIDGGFCGWKPTTVVDYDAGAAGGNPARQGRCLSLRRRRVYNAPMNTLNSVQLLAVSALPVLFAITAHEAAHGWMAYRLGDGTAKMLGRVTLNPLQHIDLLGTLIVPLATFWLTGFLFGWAKPVPIDARNLRHTRRDMALVALAGPGANLLMGLLWGLVIHAGITAWGTSEWLSLPLVYMGAIGVFINVLLMVLNLFPLVPLDGGRVLNALLPPAWSARFSRLEPYGLILLLVLLVTGVLGTLLFPVITGTIGLMPGAEIVTELFFPTTILGHHP